MFDVIIIGAGLSGLTTTYKILKKNSSLKVKILEAENTIGGQIAPLPNGEIGRKWLTKEHYNLYNLLTELRIPLRRRTSVSRNLKRAWDLDEGVIAFAAKYELKRYISDLELKTRLYRPGTYILTLEDREYTMWHHIRGKMFFESSRRFMMNFVRLVAGADPKEICYVEFMSILQSCDGLETLIQLYIDSSPAVLEFSSEELLAVLETSMDSIELIKMSKVVEIQHHPDFVQLRDTNGMIHSAKVVVLAVPWNQINDIFITPPIPFDLVVPYPSKKCYITSFFVDYEEAHWRRNGFSGNFYTADPPIYAQQYKPTSLSGYMLHDDGFEVFVKSIVLKALAQRFGNAMADPIEYNQQSFEQTSLLNLPQTTPWNRIIWSSTSAATSHRGCMSGAVQSGLRAAIHTLLILRPQNVIWQDLAEVQRATAVYQYPRLWDLLKSSLNVYNTVFYSITSLLIYCVVKNRNTILRIF